MKPVRGQLRVLPRQQPYVAISNFQVLHRSGALAVGIIVTRGPVLQQELKRRYPQRYSASTTHWAKLTPLVDAGGGGECPMILIGIETDRVTGL